MKKDIRREAFKCFKCQNIQKKITLTQRLLYNLKNDLLEIKSKDFPIDLKCGRPKFPLLVSPSDLPKRKINTSDGHGALIHSIAHIEFNAINLACDAVFRFRGLPKKYYADWIKVAAEEANHFSMLNRRLIELGFKYGDFVAHNGLWELAEKTAKNPLSRMALIPKLMEARGLDVTPNIIKKFNNIGDKKTVLILEKILKDEIGHVEIGNHWFEYFCKKSKLNPNETFFKLISEHYSGQIRGPLHKEARLLAGFNIVEIKKLEQLCQKN